jgi:hypothetical protein
MRTHIFVYHCFRYLFDSFILKRFNVCSLPIFGGGCEAVGGLFQPPSRYHLHLCQISARSDFKYGCQVQSTFYPILSWSDFKYYYQQQAFRLQWEWHEWGIIGKRAWEEGKMEKGWNGKRMWAKGRMGRGKMRIKWGWNGKTPFETDARAPWLDKKRLTKMPCLNQLLHNPDIVP